MELFRTTSCQAKVIEMLLDIAGRVLGREGTPSDVAGSNVLEMSRLFPHCKGSEGR